MMLATTFEVCAVFAAYRLRWRRRPSVSSPSSPFPPGLGGSGSGAWRSRTSGSRSARPARPRRPRPSAVESVDSPGLNGDDIAATSHRAPRPRPGLRLQTDWGGTLFSRESAGPRSEAQTKPVGLDCLGAEKSRSGRALGGRARPPRRRPPAVGKFSGAGSAPPLVSPPFLSFRRYGIVIPGGPVPYAVTRACACGTRPLSSSRARADRRASRRPARPGGPRSAPPPPPAPRGIPRGAAPARP